MKRFFTRNYWHYRREQFIRWLARDYIEAERQIFVRYRNGIIADDKERAAELARFCAMVKTYSEALEIISRQHYERISCQIANHALRPGAPFVPTGIGIEEFRRLNPKPPLGRPISDSPKASASPASPPPSAGSPPEVGGGLPTAGG